MSNKVLLQNELICTGGDNRGAHVSKRAEKLANGMSWFTDFTSLPACFMLRRAGFAEQGRVRLTFKFFAIFFR